jgi:hypothetical protein
MRSPSGNSSQRRGVSTGTKELVERVPQQHERRSSTGKREQRQMRHGMLAGATGLCAGVALTAAALGGRGGAGGGAAANVAPGQLEYVVTVAVRYAVS